MQKVNFHNKESNFFIISSFVKQNKLDEYFKMIIPEIEKYINEKDITLVVDKKNIFIANKKNNINDEIVRIIDEKLK